MKSRDEILKKLRSSQPESLPLPSIDQALFQEEADLPAAFIKSLELVGGKLIDTKESLEDKLEELFPSSTLKFSTLEGWEGFNTIDPKAIEKPHELDALDIFVTQASFGVAENGSVWLSNKQLEHRVLPFIAKQVIVQLDRKNLIETMHQAYQRPELSDFEFGLFLSGPSKTADIEQSLVIGAQGALGLYVNLI